jgi:hypothetical protein
MRKIPVEEIRFAAKHGFLSRSFWRNHFAKNSYTRSNTIWHCFTKWEYFVPHPSGLAKDVIVLNRESDTVQKLVGKAIASPPSVAQIEHDEIGSQIGLILQRSGMIQSYLTEAEVKRGFFVEHRTYKGVGKAKYPDLLLTVNGPEGARNIAVEIELSRKTLTRYRDVFRAYQERKNWQTVVFLSRSKGILDALMKTMDDMKFAAKERTVGFSSVDGWLVDPANTAINTNKGRTSLAQILVR